MTLTLATLARSPWDYGAIFIGILVIATIVYVTLRLSTNLNRFLGVNGTHAMTKIMGFIIFCIAIQFIVNGITDPELLQLFRQAPPPAP